jgi:hypothetical protein
MAVAPETLGAPGLVSTISLRETIFNQTFGGIIINLEKSETAYGYKNTMALVQEYGEKGVQAAKDVGAIQGDFDGNKILQPIKDTLAEKLPGFSTCTIPFDPLGMLTYKRVLCLVMCDKLCPLKYGYDNVSYEYSMNYKCCCCCRTAWMEVHRGSSADVESEVKGAEDTPIGYTVNHPQGCCAGPETWAIGDMIEDPEAKGEYIKGPIKYGIRNKASCCKAGCCAGWKTEKEACTAITEGDIIMNTLMPIYHNPNPQPAVGQPGAEEYGTAKDMESRSEVIGTVTHQNLLVPCFFCCAVPAACPLNIKIDIKKEYAATMNNDEKMKLGLLTQASTQLVPTPGQNMYPHVLPLPFKWFGHQTLAIVGYGFGFHNTNTEYRFMGVLKAFGNGIADTGDLISKIAGL